MSEEPETVVSSLVSQVDRLQEVQPVAALQGHDVCADIHASLSIAQIVLNSRDRRVAERPEAESGDTLLRELRAVGVEEASPQLIAMVALVDAAVDQLAAAGAMSEHDAWEQIRKEVLRRHCTAPDTL